MKILLFSLSLMGFFTTIYAISQLLTSLNSYAEWLMFSILTILFMMSVIGIALNYEGIKIHHYRVRFVK